VVYLRFHALYLSADKLINVCPCVRCGVTSLPVSDVSCTGAWKPKVNYDMLASCIVAEFNGFMSLRS
jgi:hypothetical protein